MTVADVAIVSVAGGIGCSLRVLARDAMMRRGAHPWWSTCAINLSGALLIGLVAGGGVSAAAKSATVPMLAASGCLAGWTTYSAFAMDVVQLWLRGARSHAAVVWLLTLVGTPLAAFAGAAMARAALGGAP